jgi:hypothetical protein
MNETREIARFVSEAQYEDLLLNLIDELKIFVLDALAAGFIGSVQPRARMVVEMAVELGGKPEASVINHPWQTDISRVALANGTMIGSFKCEPLTRIGRAVCHIPNLKIGNPIFSEPSQNPHYRDDVFPVGQDPVSQGVAPAYLISFDLTRDQPENQIKDDEGNIIFRLGSLEMDRQGQAIVALFGDLKRHNMGPGLAEPIDEVGTGASVFLTKNLWSVGSIALYLHDGRATTLTEAILEHGGEAASSRAAFLALSPEAQQDLLAFLNNLVLFKVEEE